jgi:membrane fusion protein (multidrug efflux system)
MQHRLSEEAAMTSIKTIPARLVCLTVTTLVLHCLTVWLAAAQQVPAPEALEYKGTVAAEREAEVASRRVS